MLDKKEIAGKFIFDQDSKRFHRFKIEAEAGIVGMIYVPKDSHSIPKKIVLEYGDKKEGE